MVIFSPGLFSLKILASFFKNHLLLSSLAPLAVFTMNKMLCVLPPALLALLSWSSWKENTDLSCVKDFAISRLEPRTANLIYFSQAIKYFAQTYNFGRCCKWSFRKSRALILCSWAEGPRCWSRWTWSRSCLVGGETLPSAGLCSKA